MDPDPDPAREGVQGPNLCTTRNSAFRLAGGDGMQDRQPLRPVRVKREGTLSTMTGDHENAVSVREYLEFLCEDAGTGLETIDDRDIALAILRPDYESQMVAIRSFLERNREAEERAAARLREIEDHVQKHGHVEHWVDHLHGRTFLDAAHSMAAVGLMAPLIESLFDRAFRYFEQEIGREYSSLSGHERWQHGDRWNCRFVWSGGRRKSGVVKGILQLADAIDMRKHLPDDLAAILAALFEYRNKMFHCGLEWPEQDRKNFANLIRSNGWTDYFLTLRSGDDPWIFYLSRDFVDHFLDTVDRVIQGIGKYARPIVLGVDHMSSGRN